MRRPSRKQARPGVEGLEGRVVLSLSPVAAGAPAPYTAIVKLDITYPDGQEFVGSGAMIDSYHVLTAGHVVYSSEHGGWASSIIAIPELHGTSEPFGSAQSTSVRTFSTWMNYDQGNPGLTSPDAMDVGLVTLDKAVGYQTGWFTIDSGADPLFASGMVFNTAGFPASSGYDGLTMQYSAGSIDGLSSSGGGIMYHAPNITIYGGQSGSPVWYPANGVVYGVAVSDAFAIRLTPGIISQLRTWMAGDVPPPAPPARTYAPPTIQGGAYTVAPGGTLTLSQTQLLAGSLDPQGLSLSAGLVTNPTRGTLTRNWWDGSYTYTPYPGIYGSDSFTIQATDGRQASNIATITIKVVPPAVSLPASSMLLVTFGSGDFYQYNAAPELFAGGVKSMSAARAANGDMYYLVVYSNDTLYRYDKTGVTPLYGGVKSASIAIDPAGGLVYDVVFNNGDLYQVDSTGVKGLYSGVNTASLTYSPTGSPVYEVVFNNGSLYQIDSVGVHFVAGGVQSASATYLSNGRLAYEIVYQGGWLVQLDDAGSHFIYGGVTTATLVNMYVSPSQASTTMKPAGAARTSAAAPVGTTEVSHVETGAVGGAARWARAKTPGRRWGVSPHRPRHPLVVTAGSARIKPWAASGLPA